MDGGVVFGMWAGRGACAGNEKAKVGKGARKNVGDRIGMGARTSLSKSAHAAVIVLAFDALVSPELQPDPARSAKGFSLNA